MLRTYLLSCALKCSVYNYVIKRKDVPAVASIICISLCCFVKEQYRLFSWLQKWCFSCFLELISKLFKFSKFYTCHQYNKRMMKKPQRSAADWGLIFTTDSNSNLSYPLHKSRQTVRRVYERRRQKYYEIFT